MLIPRFVVRMLCVGVLVLGTGMVSGQSYPNRPIRFAVSQPGGASDYAGRIIANALTDLLGQPVVVENLASVLPGVVVSKAPPDGYTLLLDGTSFLLGPLMEETPYDPVKDFAPVTLTDKSPSVLVVNPSVPANSIKELIALAKARPGELNYASTGAGGTTHLSAELFKSMAGINVVHIPYKGSGPGINAVVAGEVQVMIGTAASVAAHIKSGKLRALGVTSSEPSPLFPGLPTIAASGVPGYDATGIRGVFVPAKTPAAIINRLNQEIVRALKSADVKEKYLKAGIETVGSTPEEFAAAIKSEITKWGKVIKDANIGIK